MTQEHQDRFFRTLNKASQSFHTNQHKEAIETLELLVIYFKELFKEGESSG